NRESKEFKPTSDTDFMQINIQVDAVSCLLQDNDIPPIRISLQRFDCQIQNFLTIEKALKTLMIHGKLGSVSIYDLSPFGQLYGERFCTSGTNALVFTYTKQEDLIPITSSNFLSRLQLYLRMTSVQYIHTQRFLMDLIHFFDRFHHDQECYNRIRSAAAGQTISFSAGRSTGIELDIEAESPVLILPEYALNKRVIILHLGNIIIKNRFLFENEPGTLSSIMNKPKVSTCLLDVISIQFQDTLLYSAVYSKSDSNTQLTVKFSDFGFHTIHNDLSSMLRESCYLNIHVERNLDNSLNHASPTYSVKADLSSIDILLDTYQYSLIRGILAYNIGEPLEQPARLAMMNDDPLCVSTILTGDAYLDLLFIVQMDNVGFEIFIPQESKRNSLGYCAFIKSYFSFEKYSNNNQVLDLTCSSIKLNDTRTENNNSNEFRDILTSSSSKSTSKSNMQLEIHLLTTKTDDKYTVVLNHTRVLFIVDWLLKLNDFLSSFQQIPMQSNSSTSSTSIIVQAKKRFEIRLNFNQSELVLVQTTNNQQSNALVLSGIMSLTYREAMRQRPLDCSLFNVTLFSCQMNNIQSTAVSIIEPINITFNIHLTNEKDQHVFEVNLPQLFIRLSYSDVKLMLYMFQSIKSQIYQAQTRDIIPKYQINQPLKRLSVDSEFSIEPSFDDLYTDLRIRSTIAPSNQEKSMSIEEIDNEKQSKLFLNVHSMKFSCEQISLCLIDDCLDANIPLLNLNFASIKLNIIEYGTHRIQQADFQVNIDYYNRLLSGYEPFIEVWPLQMTLKNSTTTKSLSISSNHLLNINYTNTMHQLFDLVKNNWLEDYNSSNDINKEAMYFRRPKPFEPYCFQNLIGQRVKFRTWLSVQQRFDLNDHMVEYNETKSFIFPSEALTAKKNMYNKDFQTSSSSSSSSDRRLLILIEGWDWLQPISIDRVGTFFRLAIPTGDRLQKTMLVFIDVTMTDSSMRLITIRSPIEIRNQLLTPIDIRLKCGSGSLHDIRLEPNETRSLPLQFCPTLRQFQVRPADFTFNYCGEPINWMEIADEKRRRRQQDHESDENSAATETDSLQRHRDINSTDRRSFFRTCTMTGDDTLHFVCIQSKQTRLLAYKDHILSSYQISILPPLIINNLLPCDLFFQIYSYPHKVRLNPYKSHREHALDICQAIDITFATDLFRMTKPLRVPSINDLNLMRYHRQSVGFYDSIDRLLLVDVTIVCSIRHRLKISVSVPYVLLNKSGIPLIFKQEGSVNEVAGQSHEHELARNREPLLFSFSDQEAFHACVMKVGSGLHENDDGRPIWSQRFSLEHGSSYRQLYVRSPHGSPDWIYYIGIDVRQGKGRLRRTNFIFLSTRYMISNQCSYDLSIAQRHIVRAMLQTGDHSNLEQNCLHVLQHSNVAYHWPRSDLDQLLCVRVINNRQYRHVYWSGGIPINRVNAFHINLRYDNNQCLILRFHDDGYLCMGETQMCVQVFGELKEKSEVALGPRHFNEHGIILPPLPTMNIRPHRRLQGSGLLSVRTYADGPTRILEIANVKTNNALNTLKSEALALAAASGSISNIDNVPLMSYSFDLRLECGIGISIISSIGHESEELVFMIFNDISLAYKDNNNEQSIEVTIGTIVISNQLLMTTTPCLLYATYSDESSLKSALRLQASLQKPSANYKQLYIFHYLFIGLNGVTIQIDEILLWKLLEFFKIDFSVSSNKNAGKNDDQTYDLDEGEYDTQRLLSLLTSTQATRIYFYEVSILSIDLDLSVNCATSRSLPAHLSTIKRHAPFPLIRFENAPIHLKSYDQVHVFNTYDFFLLALTTHYVDELKRQAFKILGSVDFLGNPLGLFNDVTDGFASLVDHGSVSGLVKSVAHGVADSTSKFTGTLSYGLGKLASDEEHDDMREAIANSYRGSSIGHVIGGTVGLAAGFIGGLTSIITQPYKSVVEDGVGGLMKGVAKGIVGTVSKPMVGILDFANGLAMAVKEGARSSNTITKSRIRTTRCPTNIYGLLQPYSAFDANGQCLLYQMNKGDLTERYITRITVSQKPANAVSRRGLDNVNDDEYAVDQRDCFMHV
ncbi:unnamed protein product, partial [Rotaria magnacalcarata]